MKLSGMPEFIAEDKFNCHNEKCYIPKLEKRKNALRRGKGDLGERVGY